MEYLYVGNDHTAKLTDLVDADGQAVTDATVRATLYQSDRTTGVAGVSWPLTLSHVSGGTYSGTLGAAVQVEVGRVYRLKITAEAGGLEFTDWIDLLAAYK